MMMNATRGCRTASVEGHARKSFKAAQDHLGEGRHEEIEEASLDETASHRITGDLLQLSRYLSAPPCSISRGCTCQPGLR